MHDREYYENNFKPYPDVVTKKQLMDMLDICENTAQSLLQKEKIRHFRIGTVIKYQRCVQLISLLAVAMSYTRGIE